MNDAAHPIANMTREPSAPREHPRHGLVALIPWLVLLAIVGFVMWLVYAIVGATSGAEAACGPEFLWSSWSGGGQATGASAVSAACLGGLLWLAVGSAASALRRRFGFLFGGFVAAYIVALIALWYVSPLIWGPRYC